DASVEADLEIWDYAALVPILEEAGGRISGLDGRPPRAGDQIACSNGRLHDELLAVLAAANPK
ncbi:MAG TPA: inositol monophosphatase family protein, partial [Gaiellaceae bacterium]|nr:inositol monophosphatase family protein [Gaiellaceae bacterium]